MFGARRVSEISVICPHFSDEEIEAETSLQVGVQAGAQLPLQGETAEPYQVWPTGRLDLPPAEWGPAWGAPPAGEAQRHCEACVRHRAIR